MYTRLYTLQTVQFIKCILYTVRRTVYVVQQKQSPAAPTPIYRIPCPRQSGNVLRAKTLSNAKQFTPSPD